MSLLAAIQEERWAVVSAAPGASAEEAAAIAGALHSLGEGAALLAVVCLGEMRPSATTAEALARALVHPSLQVSLGAATSLGRHHDAAAIPALIAALASGEPHARFHAARLLGRHGPAYVEGALRERLVADSDGRVRRAIRTALARIGDAPSRERLCEALRSDALPVALDDAEYVAAPWLVPFLDRALADESPSRWIGADGSPEQPQAIRVCDRAAALIETLVPGAAGVATRGGPFTRAELDAYAEVVRRAPKS
jgi:hypothetical protein